MVSVRCLQELPCHVYPSKFSEGEGGVDRCRPCRENIAARRHTQQDRRSSAEEANLCAFVGFRKYVCIAAVPCTVALRLCTSVLNPLLYGLFLDIISLSCPARFLAHSVQCTKLCTVHCVAPASYWCLDWLLSSGVWIQTVASHLQCHS